jgi:hypothetical protein
MNPVQFGVFITPQPADIRRLQEHVQIAEAAGFDYVSTQDHPYSPAFLDTFALIGTLLGRTGRLRFMPNVANLPLRPPAMLAKTSATLDRLSGGRFELGLGVADSGRRSPGSAAPRSPPAKLACTTRSRAVGTTASYCTSCCDHLGFLGEVSGFSDAPQAGGLGLFVPGDAPAAAGSLAGCQLAVGDPVVDRVGRDAQAVSHPLDRDLPVPERDRERGGDRVDVADPSEPRPRRTGGRSRW